ncbi:MAG: tyrosinase family protein [Rhodobacter sp.]|nr:tyrosinase family protein [Rhodobacter sp.]
MTDSACFTPSRRAVLKGAVAGSLILAAPATLRAQPTFVRKNLTAPEAKADVDSYRDGVRAMLQLDPDHPHNWYRNAVTHLIDCPHGNWWFTVWHRGYLGYFEQTIRKLSKNPEFALPYWDWTTEPRIPPQFFSDPNSSDPNLRQNALDPTSDLFVDGFAAFEATHKEAYRKIFAGFDAEQIAQLTLRKNTQDPMNPIGKMEFDIFWDGWWNSIAGNFQWTRATSRDQTPAAPDLTGRAALDVRESVIRTAIRPPRFVLVPAKLDAQGNVIEAAKAGFNSVVLASHHGMSRSQATLELQPHNQVHNNMGMINDGIMPSNLSPGDPIFFMHHGNVDRIWDVWTRKQAGQGLPIGPLPQDETAYFDEKFVFFIDANGDYVRQNTTARDYFDKTRWGYGYTAGTGEDLAGAPLIASNFTNASGGIMANARFDNSVSGIAALSLSQDFAKTVTDPGATESHVAHITFVPPAQVSGVTFDVFVSPKGVAPDTSAGSPERASSFEFFGMTARGPMDGMASEPATVSVDITDALNRLEDQGIIAAGADIDVTIRVAADTGATKAVGADVAGELKSVHIESI